MENGLWGAPRIHGELLMLGFSVSERTVSRYLPDQRTRRSQTWRTFFANHVGNLALTSTMTSSFPTSHDDVDASVWPCRPVLPSRGRYVCTPWAVVDWPASHQPASLGRCFAQNHLCRGTRTRFKSARTRRGREPSELVLAALHAGLLSPRELRSIQARPYGDPASTSASVASFGCVILVSDPTLRSLESKAHISNGDAQSIGEAHRQDPDLTLLLV